MLWQAYVLLPAVACRPRLSADIGQIPHAKANSWPLLVLAGSSETHNGGKGAFQEVDAISILTPHAKYVVRPSSAQSIPKSIKDAYRTAIFGRPGPTFVDLPANLILGHYDIDQNVLEPYHEAPQSVAPDVKVQAVVEAIKSARAPLVVIGKGAAYARAERPIQRLVDQ